MKEKATFIAKIRRAGSNVITVPYKYIETHQLQHNKNYLIIIYEIPNTKKEVNKIGKHKSRTTNKQTPHTRNTT